MFANPWGFIISVLPHSSNFLYLLLGAYFPQIFFLIRDHLYIIVEGNVIQGDLHKYHSALDMGLEPIY